jgi:hypothetical protein
MPQAPDLYINSAIDPTTGDVAAFEELVGAHGGLGGWQDRAMLLVPAPLAGLLPDRIEGADTLHRSLVRMLEDAGHRGALVDRPQPRSPRPDLSATSEQA